MRDPMDELENFTTPGPPMNPLPAAEVRRRGTRLRRRNTALATAGAVAAVAIVATPIALAANRGSDTSPPPVATPGPTVAWAAQIPAGFPLAAGLAAGAASSDEPGVPRLTLCGQDAFDADSGTVDVAGVTSRGTANSDEPELTRTLALYPDASAAARAVTDLRDAVGACPSEAGPGGHTVEHELIDADLEADEAFLYTDSYVPAGEDYPDAISYYVVARTGNAVLVTFDPSTVPWDQQVTQEQERVTDVVAAMQEFSEASSTVEHPEALLPDDFPVDAGMAPEGAATAASVFTDLSGDALSGLTPCRREAWSYQDDDVVDVLGASWSDGVSGGEFRTVATYAPGAAAPAFARISDEVAGCDAVTPRQVTAGDEAVAFTDPGATTYVVVRVGDALLLIQSFDADPTDLVARAGETIAAMAARNS